MPSYPLDFPSGISPVEDKITLVSTSANSQSVYSGKQYVQSLEGQWWERELTFPPLTRAQAEELIAFLARLNGLFGTFRLGMFSANTPRGNVSGANPTVTAFNSVDSTVTVTGGPANRVSYFAVGDYFSIDGNIFKALQNVSLGASGDATFELAPRPTSDRVSISSPLINTNPTGLWRLKESEFDWSINVAQLYGLRLSCKQVL